MGRVHMASWETTIGKTEAKNLMDKKKKNRVKEDPRVKWDGPAVEYSVDDYKKSGWYLSKKQLEKNKKKKVNEMTKQAVHSLQNQNLEGLRTFIHDSLNEKAVNVLDRAKSLIASELLDEETAVQMANQAVGSFTDTGRSGKSSRERARAIIAKKIKKNQQKK